MEIYLITDLTNGKKYVGKTIHTKEHRWNGHVCGNLYVDNAIRKHGIENSTLETLEYVYDDQKLNEREQYWIKELNTLVPNGYNILPGGDCGYGRNTVHEFNKEQYLRKIFYPLARRRDAIKCKIYTIDSDDLEKLLYKVADFEPYKSNKSLNDLSKDEWINWYRFSDKFTTLVYDVVGHDNLCNIAKNVTYAPSIKYIADNSYDEYQISLDVNTISKCVHEHMLLKLDDEYMIDDEYDFLYITRVDNEKEYINFAENKIKEILLDWEENPEKLEEVIQHNRHIVEMKTRDKEARNKQELQDVVSHLREFLRLYANMLRVTKRKDQTFSVYIDLGFDKYNSGKCDNELDALMKCKEWMLSTLNMQSDSFEKYHNDIKYEESLLKSRKRKKYIACKNARKEQEEVIKAEKRLRKKLTTQN